MKTLKLQLFWMAVPALLLAAGDPFVGTWKMDVDKSTFAKGSPGYFDATVQIEAVGANGLKSTVFGADSDGFAGGLEFSCTLNGVPCTVVSSLSTRSTSVVDSIALKMVNDRSLTATATNKGKPVYTDQRVVSADGKTMTITRKGSTADGKAYANTIVLTRIK